MATRIIKSAVFETRAGRDSAFNFTNIEEASQRIIDETDRQVKDMMGRANLNREEMYRQAVEQGQEAGYQVGFKAGQEEGARQALEEGRRSVAQDTASARATVDAISRVLSSRRLQLEEHGVREVVSLALAMAEQVVRREIRSWPEAVLPQVEAALALVLEASECEVAVHPADQALVEQYLPEWSARYKKIRGLTVVSDPAAARAGCQVRFRDGQVNMQLATKLEQLKRSLLGEGEGA